MQALIDQATAIAEQLKAGGQTLSISESSTGGLLSASLLAVPGASAYYLGGAIVYTRRARALLRMPSCRLPRPSCSAMQVCLYSAKAENPSAIAAMVTFGR